MSALRWIMLGMGAAACVALGYFLAFILFGVGA
jgi:hypothetical protein